MNNDSIKKMPIIKPMSFFVNEAVISRCFSLDEKLRCLAAIRSVGEAGMSLEVLMASWLQKECSGGLTEKFSWSRLAGLSQTKPRSLDDIHLRSSYYSCLEKEILQYKGQPISKRLIRKLGGTTVGLPDQTIRSGNMYTDEDTNGMRTMFIPAKAVNGQMRKIVSIVNGHSDPLPVSLKAIWVLVAFLNCHPFSDGNGRTARALFNLILIKTGICEQYSMPLSALSMASKGFFEMCLRRVQLQNNMDMMIQYMDTAIDLTEQFYRKRVKSPRSTITVS